MRLRSLYTLVGGAWGAVIALPATVLVSGYLLAAAWLFFFGDDPWPARAWLVILPGILLGVAIFVWATSLGYRFGARAEGAVPERQAIIRRRAAWWIGGALIVGLLQAGVVAASERRQQAERDQRAELIRNFDRLVRARHSIGRIDVVAPMDEEAGVRVPSQAAVTLSGERAGVYRIAWELTETLYDTPLLVGEERLTLAGGDTTVLVPIDMRTLRERYRSEVLGGRGGVLVESDWPLKVSIRPLLSGEEARSVPRSERQNLRLGMSALISEAQAPVPVEFRID